MFSSVQVVTASQDDQRSLFLSSQFLCVSACLVFARGFYLVSGSLIGGSLGLSGLLSGAVISPLGGGGRGGGGGSGRGGGRGGGGGSRLGGRAGLVSEGTAGPQLGEVNNGIGLVCGGEGRLKKP
jgi:hypothetical protein